MPRVASLWFPTLSTDRLRARASSHDDMLVTAIVEHGRRVVAACSAGAHAAGLRPGQPLAQARVLLAGLRVADADPEGDAMLLRRLALHAARRWTPLVACDGADGLLLDIGASAHLLGGEAGLVRRVTALARRAGLAVRIAVAGSAGAAHALARYAGTPAIVVPAGDDDAAVTPLPPAALRLDPATCDTLARLGFATIGALLDAPRGPLIRRFGAPLDRRLGQITGRRAEPIAPLIPPTIPKARRGLLEPILTSESIYKVIEDLAHDLCGDLEIRMQGARQLVLVCARVDTHDQCITVGLARPSRAPAHLIELLGRRIETIDPGFGIETMTLAAICVQRLAPVQDMILRAGESGPDLALLIDRLANRFGARALSRVRPAASDAPGRMVTRCAPLDPPARATWRADWPRPSRLLRRPDRIERFIAGLPDHAPDFFVWRGTRYHVTGSDGPERIHGEWWRGGERFRARDYFQVEVVGGGRYWLFRLGDGRDPETGPGDWFVHGAFA